MNSCARESMMPIHARPLVSVILPVRDQADHVHAVVTEHLSVLSEKIAASFEIILICNGCQDESLSLCRQLADAHESVRVLESEITGWGAAVKLGIANSLGDLICFANSARVSSQVLSYCLQRALEKRNSVFMAVRSSQDNMLRKIGSALYNFTCRKLFSIETADVNGTPKIFPRSFDKLLGLTQNEFLVDLEFIWICRREKYPIVEIPVQGYERHGGKSMTTIFRGVELMAQALMWRLKADL